MDLRILKIGDIDKNSPFEPNGLCESIFEGFQSEQPNAKMYLGLPSPTQAEILSLSTSFKRLGIYTTKSGALFLLLETEFCVFDFPFNACVIDAFTAYDEVDIKNNISLAITLILLDSNSNEVCFLNHFALPANVFVSFRDAALHQRATMTSHQVNLALNDAVKDKSVFDMIAESEMFKV